MRILIVHNLLWAHYKSSVFQALQRLADQQPDVTVHVLQIARNERSRAGLETVTDTHTPTYLYSYELLFDRFLEDVSLRERAVALFQRAKAFRPDVINLTGYYDPAQLLLLLWAKANGIRVVMQNESTAADHQRGGLKESFKRWVFSQCDGFFCFGNQSAEYLNGLGVAPEKILLRKNAVDNHALRTAYEQALTTRSEQQTALGLRPNNFIFVGRLIEFKNLPALLSAFAEALAQSANAADWGLLLLGDGAEKDALTKQIAALGLTDIVQILPGRPWFLVPDILALSNVLVLPSRSEPWGLVVNEAMACGLPVIVSDRCGCVPDLVRDGQNGFIFSPDQPALLTRLLLRFMNNEVNAEQMGQSGRQTIAPYAPEAVAQEMLDGFMKITA
ncbi:glycosyltransferase [Spirosoma taeanense]|uniref:Glycosyltransferase n=1 Tax=Spirosoma taeanense TaxID=2735870 RepID=A0A6M5Y8X5_9BACT|nr:glycosyltransferase [Spirosoma taeanense]QJW90738.1 glycosyltransferase [Spirosoma taeanense]